MTVKHLFVIVFSSLAFILAIPCCSPKPPVGQGESFFELSSNSTVYRGKRTKDPSLKAETIPCQDNNTFRLYYSDSAAMLGLPDSITIVSYYRKDRLKYKECCIEATSSATDTWLSTGSGNKTFKAGTGKIEISGITVQHFTSTPQPDSTTLFATLEAL